MSISQFLNLAAIVFFAGFYFRVVKDLTTKVGELSRLVGKLVVDMAVVKKTLEREGIE